MVSVLRTSPVCASEAGAGVAVEFGDASGFENDPDLEMALRMSLEEHRQATGEAVPGAAPAVQDQPMPSAPGAYWNFCLLAEVEVVHCANTMLMQCMTTLTR